MRILVACITCHKFRDRADAQRKTWVPDLVGADIRFFVGGGEPERPDEVILPVDDGYRALPEKVKYVFQWALNHGYDWCVKIDDDVYLRPDRLLNAIPKEGGDHFFRRFRYDWIAMALARRAMLVLHEEHTEASHFLQNDTSFWLLSLSRRLQTVQMPRAMGG